MTRVLVCGGRYFGEIPKGIPRGTPRWAAADRKAASQRAFMFRALATYTARHGMSVLIHGAASGADKLAASWAQENGILVEPYPAGWSDLSHPDARIKKLPGGRLYDANAGPRRNRRMLREGKPDAVIAFEGGDGTADMVQAAIAAGLDPVRPEEVAYLTAAKVNPA